MQVIACYCVFNEEEFLRASLSLILPYVDQVWLLDGPYKQFNHEEPHSTDNTLAIISDFKNAYPSKVHLLASQEWVSEIEKRNYYLSRIPFQDWCFVIDGDELPWGNLYQLKPLLAYEPSTVTNILLQHTPLQAPIPHARLIHKLEHYRYEGHHARIIAPITKKNILSASDYNYRNIMPIFILHLGAYRSQERMQSKDFYYLIEKAKEEPAYGKRDEELDSQE